MLFRSRTLMAHPQVLLLDEPTSATDAAAAKVIEQAVRSLADDDGVPAVWVTHDPAQVERIADRVLHIESGRCAGVGPAARGPGDGEVRQ